MIIYRILLLTLLQLLIIFIIFITFYRKPIKHEAIKKVSEERNNDYLRLQNMTTKEILTFKRKEDFIKDVGCYDVLRNFYNDNEIIEKCYPNYKRLE